MKALFSFLFLLLAAAVQALSATGSRLLVILDDVADKSEYSTFLGDLTKRGLDITLNTPKSESLTLFHLGERTYDHVIILPTKIKGLGPNLTPKILLDFINADGNMLLALSSDHTVPSSIVGLLAELEIAIPADRTGLVVDHFDYDVTSAVEKHDVETSELIAFPRGIGHVLGSGPLLTPILRAPRTAYLYNPKEHFAGVDPSELFAAGEQLGLVSAMQARNSARLTMLGSAEMLKDEWFNAKVKKSGGKEVKTWNREFAKRVSGWTFHEIGVLRVNWIEHHLNEAGGSNESNPTIYRVKNDVSYAISMSEYTWSKWGPYVVPDGDDLQLEFSMLSPFHRLSLGRGAVTGQDCTYSVSFTLPDQHGIFNFKVNYKRPFLSVIDEKNTVSVRHMAHDEWPRSYVISGAWPWITGIGATITGFLAFCALWMYNKPTNMAKESKKTQ